MKQQITLNDFIFALNQDEDILVTVIDYLTDEEMLPVSWKTSLNSYSDYQEIKDRFVEYFFVETMGYNTKMVIYINR